MNEEKTIKVINVLNEKGIPFKLNTLENGGFSILTKVPIDDLLIDAGVVDNTSKVYKEGMTPVSLGEMTSKEIKFEESLPFPMCYDIAVMREMNDTAAYKVADIIGEAAHEATNVLLNYVAECIAHISHDATIAAVSEAKEEMCKIIDKGDNYNEHHECCSTPGGGHCKCNR